MKTILPAISLALLVGCMQDDTDRGRISALEARLAASEEKAAALEMRVRASEDAAMKMASTLSTVQIQMWSKIEAEQAAIVDPVSKGYSIARNDYGAFPVIIEDAQPYLDGHKVKFRIGNLTSATMTDVKLQLT